MPHSFGQGAHKLDAHIFIKRQQRSMIPCYKFRNLSFQIVGEFEETMNEFEELMKVVHVTVHSRN
jgi:hypothetical protein